VIFAEAIHRTIEIAERYQFSLEELRYRYPSEWIPAGETAQSYLERLTWQGVKKRYQSCLGGIPEAVIRQIEHELRLIAELQFADYFLTIWEIVEFSHSRQILCQGRGSAANSAVCYCLGSPPLIQSG
jgi:error-prone DNA polymerase